MKKFFYGLILCTVLLGGCSAKGENGISETAILVANSVAVTTESPAETVSETETTAITTTRTTTVAEPAEKEIILTPIPSEEPFEVMSCQIIENAAVDNEEDFPDKEVIKRAREICFTDKDVMEHIELYNNGIDEGYYSCNYDDIKVENPEDIFFSCGMAFDFDNDGKDEYVIALDFTPLSPMDGGFLILTDGSEYEIFVRSCGDISVYNMKIISSGYLYFPMVTLYSGQWCSMDIYSFENDKPKDILDFHREAHGIGYENGIFLLEIKYTKTIYPFVLCGDGKFRQLGREKISREKFEAHVQNGGKYLDSLAENGETITEIYTYGYYHYELYGEGFRYDIYGNYFADDNTFLTEKVDCDGVHGELYFTDEVVYGDVWAVKEIN